MPTRHTMTIALAALAIGCKGSAESSSAPPPPPSATVSLPPPAPPPPAPPPPKPACRVVLAAGAVTIADAGALATAAAVPDAWIDLAAGAKLTTKDPTSARETNFVGPAHVRACVGGEESWVARGAFASAPGSGERPGGEEWVVTPLGIVMYAAEDVQVHVTPDEVAIDAKGTHARVWFPEGDVAPTALTPAIDVWSSLAAQHATLRRAKGTDAELTKSLVGRCNDAADVAKGLAAEIAAPDAALGELAGRHVKARQLARAACEVARLRVAAMPASEGDRAAWTRSVEAADARWHELSRNP